MFDWLGNAWDSFTGLFDGGGYTAGDPTSSVGQSVLGDIDIDNSGTIGDMSIGDYQPGYDYSSLDSSFGDPFTLSNTPTPTNKPGNNSPSWWQSPAVLGAAITSGAGLLGNLNSLNAQQSALKAQQEQQKMNQLLELAKLKYQLMGKGAKTSGGRRASGPSGPTPQQINAQYSGNLVSGYNNVGSNLAALYR